MSLNVITRPADFDGPALQALALARNALANAYAPFSRFQVAAVLLFDAHPPVVGVNYESASFGLTLCAERAAIAAAQAQGALPQLHAVLLTASASAPPEAPVTPCGACRQWLHELAVRIDRDFPIYCVNAAADRVLTLRARGLLPDAFNPDCLP